MNRISVSLARLRMRRGLLLAAFVLLAVTFTPRVSLNSTFSAPAFQSGSFSTSRFFNATQGNFHFRQAVDSTVSASPGLRCLGVGDFNHDRIPDLAVARATTADITIFTGDGNGHFTPAAIPPIATGPAPSSLRVDDFNQDGNPDLALADSVVGDVRIFLGDAQSGFMLASVLPVGLVNDMTLVTGDFNRDNHPDLGLALHSANRLRTFKGNGFGGFEAGTELLFPTETNAQSLTCGDFNQDGVSDLATLNLTARELLIWLGTEKGGFASQPAVPLSGYANLNPASLVSSDFNLDGKPDFLILSANDHKAVLLAGNGTAGYLPSMVENYELGWGGQSVEVADFNLDGRPDLIAKGRNNANLTLLFNKGTTGTAPTVRTANGLSRQQGSAGRVDPIALVFDAETPNGQLVTNFPALPPGLGISNLTNDAGTVSALITVTCDVAVGDLTVPFTVTDGDGNITNANLLITIFPNAPVTLGSYPSVTVYQGNPITVSPTVSPSDNGTVVSVTVSAGGGFTGNLSIIPSTGVVTLLPTSIGVFPITVSATDNCGLVATTTFTLGSTPLQKGPFITSVSPLIGIAGTRVTISGANFDGATLVTVNGASATFTVDAPTQITFFVPPTATTGQIFVSGPRGFTVGPSFTVIRRK
ncbi:MAG: FG-GAP-like repeat-containing protein [Blastocatellia bacterium]|nr:FG-GAP-like repeat-containing protein [Blastocatellia bacterium]